MPKTSAIQRNKKRQRLAAKFAPKRAELKAILPELEKPLGQGGAGRFRLETPKP